MSRLKEVIREIRFIGGIGLKGFKREPEERVHPSMRNDGQLE